MDNGKTVQDLMIKQLDGIEDSIRDLDTKVDRKMDLLHQRVTEENTAIHNRITLEETKRIKTDVTMGSLVARVNWLYVIAGGLVVTFAGTVAAVILSTGE